MLQVFRPEKPPEWSFNGRHICYHPFLVIGETLADRPQRTAWLPYWHTDEQEGQRQIKYGQWAPHMDLDIFSELVEKARAKNLLPWSKPT